MSDESAQPTIDQAYETAGNPTDKEPVEKSKAQANAKTDEDNAVASRKPGNEIGYNEATPSSMGRGVRGAGPGEETKGATQESLNSQELDADQMGAPGEGKVADAVAGKHSGASGQQPGLESDLDRKKAEQAGARKAVQEDKKENFDVGGILGQRGGPANPVDKGNYPNSGD